MEIPLNKLVAQDNVKDNEGSGDIGSEEQQFFKLINEMEQKCQSSIKANEEIAYTERLNRKTAERKILQQRAQFDAEKLFQTILEKSIYQKARDRMSKSKKTSEETEQDEKQNDFLRPILKKLSLDPNAVLDEEAAIHVKNEALKNLKERLLTRAEIIQRRLNEEQQNLETAFVSIVVTVNAI